MKPTMHGDMVTIATYRYVAVVNCFMIMHVASNIITKCNCVASYLLHTLATMILLASYSYTRRYIKT